MADGVSCDIVQEITQVAGFYIIIYPSLLRDYRDLYEPPGVLFRGGYQPEKPA